VKAWEWRVEDGYSFRKYLANVGSNHPISEKLDTAWLNATIEILKSYVPAWNSIDFTRIGYRDEKKLPVILWIGVSPGSASPENGFEAARACRNELRNRGIFDVECEIREAVVTLSTTQKVLTKEEVSQWQSYSLTEKNGQSVALEADPKREATLGGYLALTEKKGGIPETYGITSRHLVLGGMMGSHTTRTRRRPRVIS